MLLQGIRGSLSGVLEYAKPCLLVINKVLEDLFATIFTVHAQCTGLPIKTGLNWHRQ